jgi:23S rRNA (cytidine1920-2'-O)/16S rRNA (cytidine1409-2'-O)-methyltransferase
VKERADKVLADLKLVTSRSQAKSLIEKGDVLVDGITVRKASELISPSSKIEINVPLFVGRGAFKLEKALEEFKIDVQDKVILDVGASTGGFTEILLMKDAAKVYAIDVGHGQLAAKIRLNPKVINLEGTNIKDLTSLPELADGAVMDLSFISITKVLEHVKNLLKPQSFLMALVKPQFEAGVERLPKDGVVKDEVVRTQILNEVIQYAVTHGWSHMETIVSPIQGKSGNVEFLVYFISN